MSARILWLWLATRRNIGARTCAALLDHFGSVEAIYAADRRALAEAPGVTFAQVNTLCDKSTNEAARIVQDCEAHGIAVLTIADAGYPDRLRQIADPPVVLYVRGTLPDLDSIPGIAVVGTRKPSPYGLATAQSMAQSLTEAGFVIVSGMALGVDGAAGRGALRAGGKTVAVLGCGLDRCYPIEHQQLMGDILLSGAVISEYPPGTEPLPQHFPARNRIISGLCVGTLVVEAGKRSGALITARDALDQGRDVFAVPGNVDMESFAGANDMISRGEAMLVSSPLPMIREYAALLPSTPDEARCAAAFARQVGTKSAPPHPEPQPQAVPARETRGEPMPLHLSEEEQRIVHAVREGAGTADEIIARTELPAPLVASSVIMLELDGVLVRKGGRLVIPD